MNRALRSRLPLAAAVAVVLAVGLAPARADPPGDPAAVRLEDGKYFDKNGDPTYRIAQDGTVDWYTYVGFVRYSAECLRCHGPDGLGSSYGPVLTDTLRSIGYSDFYAVVASGKQNVNASENLVMPALGNDRNVMCNIDPIYVYLRARANGALGRGRPDKHAPKPDAFSKAQDECMG